MKNPIDGRRLVEGYPPPMWAVSQLVRETGLVENTCAHGVGHPHPLSVERIAKGRVASRPGARSQADEESTWSVHGCDGCCSGLRAERKQGFEVELRSLLNSHSQENGSNTPDFVLATYLLLDSIMLSLKDHPDQWGDAVKQTSENGSDLSLVTTDALLDALKARFDHMIFSGLKKEEKPGVDQQQSDWEGYSVMCQGMAAALIREIQDWEREPDPEP